MPASLDLGRDLQDTTREERAALAKWLTNLATQIEEYRPGDEGADWRLEQKFYDLGRDRASAAR